MVRDSTVIMNVRFACIRAVVFSHRKYKSLSQKCRTKTASDQISIFQTNFWKVNKQTNKICCLFNFFLVGYFYVGVCSVSPSPKKGHGKVAKKGHFLTRGNMSKGHT